MNIIRSPKLEYIGTVSNDPQWTFPLHEHENICEILFILDGEGRMIINSDVHYVKKGDIIVFNSKTLHEEFSCSHSPIEFIYFGIRSLQIEGLEKNTILSDTCNPIVNMDDYYDSIKTILLFVYKEFLEKEKGYEKICTEQLSSIIRLIQRVSFANEKEDDEELLNGLAIKTFLDKNYKEHMSLKELALEFNISPYYLSHLFFESYQISPINYVNNRRMGDAKWLLLNTDKKVKEIAQLLGYTNENYFSHFFKNKTGISPLSYRKKSQQENRSLNL